MSRSSSGRPRSRSTRSTAPFSFVVDHLATSSPIVKPMFGSHMVYVRDKMVFFLVSKENDPENNGICFATRTEHRASLIKQFPSLRPLDAPLPESFGAFGTEAADWLLLPASAEDFETAAITACELVTEGDSRIGRNPVQSQPAGPTRQPRRNKNSKE
jgi:hypothetical protein